MRFLSLFSGIEAASEAFIPLGWEPVAFAEIEKFPAAVLAERHPLVPNLGDVTKITKEQIESLGAIDIVVFGFPCQDLSVAGKRKGLEHADGTITRSGLFYTAMQIVRWSGARWALAENVPGLLTSNGGRDFASVVGELCGSQIGLPRDGWRNSGVALGSDGLVEWATLDAQYFGLAQRRKRVFLVRDIGDWQSREPLLLEPASLRRDSPPSRGKGEGVTGTLSARTEGGGGLGGGLIEVHCMATGQGGAEIGIGIGTTLNCNHEAPIVTQEVTHSLTGEGFDASEDGSGRGTPLIAVNSGAGYWKEQPHAGTLGVSPRDAHENNLVCVHGTQDPCTDEHLAFALGRNSGQENAIAFATTQITSKENRSNPKAGDPCHPLAAGAHAPAIATTMAVRRLSPVECARLQGFPDHHTDIMPKGKPTPDGPQYKAYGNSMAVPCMAWIGKRLSRMIKP